MSITILIMSILIISIFIIRPTTGQDGQDGQDEHIENIRDSADILPAWFIPLMMDDEWTFGLLLATNDVLVIKSINRVTRAADGGIWIDVNMEPDKTTMGSASGGYSFLYAPCERMKASINAAHVVAAFELADT